MIEYALDIAGEILAHSHTGTLEGAIQYATKYTDLGKDVKIYEGYNTLVAHFEDGAWLEI